MLKSWSPVVLQRLPFAAQLLGSQNDPVCSLERAQAFATAWGAEFVDCGRAGHINAETGLGDWPEGHDRLQALIAREPAEQRPSIRAWLPPGFLPPQVTVIGEQPSAEVMMVRALSDRGRPATPLTPADVCYWHGDLF